MTYREAYETWLKEFADDQATVDELKAIAGDEKEIEDRFYTELSFGTAGMRGVLGAGTNRMNLYNVRRATKGFADYINSQNPEYRQRGVVIAYDSRRMSPEFAKASALVLCHEGIHVYLFDELRPVPILSYAVRHLHAIAGIVITASHNPAQYNGYKVYGSDGCQITQEAAESITDCIEKVPYGAPQSAGSGKPRRRSAAGRARGDRRPFSGKNAVLPGGPRSGSAPAPDLHAPARHGAGACDQNVPPHEGHPVHLRDRANHPRWTFSHLSKAQPGAAGGSALRS